MKLDIRIIGALAIVILVSGAAVTLLFSQWSSAWEVGVDFDSALMNGNPIYSSGVGTGFQTLSYANNVGFSAKVADGDPSDVPVDVHSTVFRQVYAQHPELFGSAHVVCDIGGVYPVTRDAYGEAWYQTADDVPYRTYTKQDANGTWYFFDHYVYVYTVDMETDGKAEAVGSYVYGTCEGLPSIYEMDHEVQVRVFTEFGINPWSIQNGQIVQYQDTSVQITDAFYGVMSSSVAIVEAGTIITVDEVEYDMKKGGLADPSKDFSGALLAMWRTDDESTYGGHLTQSALKGNASAAVQKVPKTIPTRVLVETGADLEPVLLISYGTWPGTWADWSVIDTYVRYYVRMDVVYTAGLVMLTGEQDPPGNKTQYQPPDDVKTIWELLGEAIGGGGLGIGDFLWDIMVPAVVIGVVIIVIVLVIKRPVSVSI